MTRPNAVSRATSSGAAAAPVAAQPGTQPVAPPVPPSPAAGPPAPAAQAPTAPPADPLLPHGLVSSTGETSNRQLLAWMFRFVAPVKGLAAIACAYLALYVGFEVLTTRQVGEAVNQIRALHTTADATAAGGLWRWIVSGDPQAVALRHAALGLLALASGMALLRYLREVSQMKMSMEMVYHLREAVYDKLQRVGFSFHDTVSTGQLINRALTDLQNVRSFLQTAVLTVLEIVLIVGGYIILLLTIEPWVALLALAPLPIWTWYIMRFSKTIQPASKAVMEAGDRNVSLITENIAGVHVVKAFATEDVEIRKYEENCDSYFQRIRHRIKLFANFNPIIRAIASASQLTLALAVAIFVLRGDMEVGHFLVLGAAMGAILGRLQQVSQINDQYQNAIVSARRLYEVLMAAPNVPEQADAPPLPAAGTGAVRFDHVTFGYAADKPVLKDITFDVPGGSVVAIVGPTGAGKSTLVSLVARFYDPQQGRILIDGVDIRDVSLESLRRNTSFVFQETYLFSDTVSNNIAYGRPGTSQGEIEAAARLAQAHEFIEQLPDGYNTVLAERGSSLSGGQRQRLAIARAILLNPRILVLDDATAAVDPETEDLIRKGMRFVMFGRTTFVIAHRLSTVKQADQVVVLEDGRITQMGTHNELMRQEGHYREIAYVQLYGDETPPAHAEEPPSHMDRVRDPRKVTAEAANRAPAEMGLQQAGEEP